MRHIPALTMAPTPTLPRKRGREFAADADAVGITHTQIHVASARLKYDGVGVPGFSDT